MWDEVCNKAQLLTFFARFDAARRRFYALLLGQ
jgi:hypothetical protein